MKNKKKQKSKNAKRNRPFAESNAREPREPRAKGGQEGPLMAL